MLTIDPATIARRNRLQLHANLEARILAYVRDRENPFDEPEARYAYLCGQLDLIGELRRCAVADALDA